MKILLINPTYDGIIVAPHLGLGYLSSGLKKNNKNENPINQSNI